MRNIHGSDDATNLRHGEEESNSSEKKSVPKTSWFNSSGRVHSFWLFLLALGVRILFVWLAGNNGTDAWARFVIARSWLENPSHLPSEVWLPLHFWLLGAALWIWDSEWSARLLTVFLGALTVLFLGAFVRKVFGARVAIFSALMFALFGFHIAYSVTTSSEGPTLFFIMLGLYAWVRFRFEDRWNWLLLSSFAFSAASLCRIEAWLYIPVLVIGLLDFSGFSQGLVAWLGRQAWGRMIGFALMASGGAAGWMFYSLLKWGDPLAVAKRSAWLSVHLNIHQPLFNRLIAVPGALIVTLSPVIVALAFFGMARVLLRAEWLAMVPALLVVVLGGANCFNAITKNSTMARYTLMYSWLLIPYAFEGLREVFSRWPTAESRRSFASVVLLVLLWQAGIIVGAHYGPARIADKLSSVSPTLPLDVELRNLVLWLRAQTTPNDAVIFDDFNYEAINIIRYAGVPPSQSFRVPYLMDPALLERQLRDFMARAHPRFLVYSPRGQLRSIWPLDDREEINFDKPKMQLRRRWQARDWRVYEIEYFREVPMNSVSSQNWVSSSCDFFRTMMSSMWRLKTGGFGAEGHF